jgi:glycosyltransferase involved in cell wall biosynthesis
VASDGVRPHVVMVAANDIAADARVRKYAESVSQLGYAVTVVGIGGASREEGRLGDVTLIRLPVPYRLRNSKNERHSAVARMAEAFTSPISPSRRRLVVSADRRRLRERERSASIGLVKARMRRANDPVSRRVLLANLKSKRALARLDRKVWDAWATRYRRRLDERSGDRRPKRRTPALPRRRVDWRSYAPEFLDLELAFGPELDRLGADLLHVHDVHLIGVAARTLRRARGAGRNVVGIYDAHEFIPGLHHADPRYVRALAQMEREFIGDYDAIVAVSPEQAALLADTHRLTRRPPVVLNAPIAPRKARAASRSLRSLAGVAEEALVLVYSGGVNPGRGIETLVLALNHLPNAHAVIVTNRMRAPYTKSLARLARQQGTRSRLHFVPFVPPDEVVGYLAEADIGIHPMIPGYANHDIALPNKILEYVHAGLPVVVSELPAMATFVREQRVGTTFRPLDPEALAAAVRHVTEHRETYRRAAGEVAAARRFTWGSQQVTIQRLYAEVLGEADERLREIDDLPPLTLHSPAAPHEGRGRAPIRLAVGPENMSGQAWAWARAVERNRADVEAVVFEREKDHAFAFPYDRRIAAQEWVSFDWQLEQLRSLSEYTHALFEFGHGLLGTLAGGTFHGDLPLLVGRGVHCALVCHGSDVRDPELHASLEPHSPFHQADPSLVRGLQRKTEALRAEIDRTGIQCFVSTPGLLDQVSGARWLPVTVDAQTWPTRSAASGANLLRVGHFPSQGIFKGSEVVDAVAERLAAAGLIEYVRLPHMAEAELRDVMRTLDVLIDGIRLGDYGVTACQAMATGVLVLGNVGERVRRRLTTDVPIVHVTPDTLEDVLADIAHDRAAYREQAASGPAFVERFHDGTYAATVLYESFLAIR